jgi:hypothetical protein
MVVSHVKVWYQNQGKGWNTLVSIMLRADNGYQEPQFNTSAQHEMSIKDDLLENHCPLSQQAK